MAISWFTVLKMVPWGDVIENAPKVAQGARHLWKTVGKSSGPTSQDGTDAASGPDQGNAELSLPEVQRQLAGVQSQLGVLQAQNLELHEQVQSCARLITSLADQNTQLINRVEWHRRVGLLLILLVAGLMALALWLRG